MAEPLAQSAPRLDLAASPRLFRNPVLDKLSRVHHWMPVILYGPVIAVAAWFGLRAVGGGTFILALLGGYAVWGLFEYSMHKFVFHFVPPGALGARLHFLIHGVHHDHPNDGSRLVMPPLVSLPILAVMFVLARLICGPALAWPVFAGFLAGYVAYDMLHYHLHHGRPRSRWGAELRRRHMLHHFQDATRGYGISCPWWDDVLGTKPAPISQPD